MGYSKQANILEKGAILVVKLARSIRECIRIMLKMGKESFILVSLNLCKGNGLMAKNREYLRYMRSIKMVIKLKHVVFYLKTISFKMHQSEYYFSYYLFVIFH